MFFILFSLRLLIASKVNCHAYASYSELDVSLVLHSFLPGEHENIHSGAELNLQTNKIPAVRSVLPSCAHVVGYYGLVLFKYSVFWSALLVAVLHEFFEVCNICKN